VAVSFCVAVRYRTHDPASPGDAARYFALDLLRQIMGYMNSYKAIRTRLALNKYLPLTPRNGRYTIAQLAARDEFEAEFLAIRP